MKWNRPALVVAVLLGACRAQPPVYPVESLQVSGATLRDNALMGLSSEEVRARLTQALTGSGRFALGEQARARSDARWRLTLDVPFTREAQKEGSRGTVAEVGASLSLECTTPSGPQRYEVVGLGEVAV